MPTRQQPTSLARRRKPAARPSAPVRRSTKSKATVARRAASPRTARSTTPLALLIGTRKGAFILRGDVARRNWKMESQAFIANIVHHVVMDPRDPQTILACVRSGHLGPTIYRSTDHGQTWQEAAHPPAFGPAAKGNPDRTVEYNFWLSPGHAEEPNVWYVGTSPQGLFRSTDGGATWDEVHGFNEHPLRETWAGPDSEGPPGGPTLHSILIDPRDPRHMYISLSGGGAFESTDQGKDWQPIGKGLVSEFLPVPDAEYGHDPHATRMSPADPDRLYMQSHTGVYRMDRSEGVWKHIGANLPSGISDHGFPMVLHPRDRDTAWIFPVEAFPYGRVPKDGKPATYVTHDGGETWQRQDRGLPKKDGWFTVKRQAMSADTRDPLGLYFGTTGGEVWASRDAGESWTRIAEHLPEIYSIEPAEW